MDRGPTPAATADGIPFWRGAAEGRFRLPHCIACAAAFYPPPPRCPICLADALEWRDVAAEATLVEWSRVHRGGPPGLPSPFTVARASVDAMPGVTMIAALDPAVAPIHGMELKIGFDSGGFPRLTART